MSETADKNSRPLVFVVDDEPLVTKALSAMLRQAGCEVTAFSTGSAAIEALGRVRPLLVLLDLVLPGMDGIEVLRRIREVAPDVAVVMVSGQGTIKGAVDALKLGASDFLEKPVDQTRLEAALARALEYSRLRRQVSGLRADLSERFRIVGQSKALGQVRDLISRAAPTTASVLITGESGVGKELVARAIHLQSLRQPEPFVALDCAAIPKELIENELFGHERGALASAVPVRQFTGAGAARKGKLQEADKGSLFLDEVADLPLAAQARLFRFLEHPEVERPGSSGPTLLDVRVMAATNKDIAACIRDGSFHDDLYRRLNVVTIKLPALRERIEDIEELTAFFLDRFCRQHNRELSLAPACQAVLRGYNWPGNVRELRDLVERVAMLARTNPVEPDELRSLMGVKMPVRREGVLRTTMNEHLREALVGSLSVDSSKRRRRRRHRLSHRVGRWLRQIPRRTMATLIVALAFVFALLLILLWKKMTGEWLFDTIFGAMSGSPGE